MFASSLSLKVALPKSSACRVMSSPVLNSFQCLSKEKPSACNLLRIATISASVSGSGDPCLSLLLPLEYEPAISESSAGLESSAGTGEGDIWCMISDKANWGGFSIELIGGSNEGTSKPIFEDNEILADSRW